MRFERASRLNAGLPQETAFYHVHSLAPHPADPEDVLGTAEYGERFATAVARDNVFGVQFHPEKSSTRRPAGCSPASAPPATANGSAA